MMMMIIFAIFISEFLSIQKRLPWDTHKTILYTAATNFVLEQKNSTYLVRIHMADSGEKQRAWMYAVETWKM
jgi:hypothetical protein